MLKKTVPLGNDEEGRCFQLGLASEKHGEWRLAWELFFGLVEHLGTLRSTTASEMYAHAAVRCASLSSRVQGLVSFCDIPVLCSHLRVCFIETLGERKLGRRLPAPRKLLEWIVHVAVPLNAENCDKAAIAATECWQQVRQALLQGGDQAMRALMDHRSSEEQTQLLRLLGHHARNVQPGAADVVADIMQRLLQQLVQNDHEGLKETSQDAALWLKTIATALEGLILHLSCSSQKTSSLLDWADDFLAQLGAVTGGVTGRLQPLHAVLARGRLRAMEAFRATTSSTMLRSEAFKVWKEPIFQQLQVLAKQEGRSVKYGEVPAQLQPMFQLAGLLPRRVEHMEHLEHVEHVEHWCHKAQSFESLRLQLPPGPISAILAICQLQLHYQIFTSNFHFKVIKFSSKAAVSAVSAGSFGRLVISLAMDPQFRAVLGSSGASLALQALRAQLEHCTSGCAEMGRMRFLQVQACALQAQLDGDPEDCKRFMNLALDEWQGVVLERWSDMRTPCSLMKALEAAGHQRCDRTSRELAQCVRDLSDAAYLMETLDLHALCMGALALCLACTVQQNGREALSWLQGTDDTKQSTLPRSSRELLVILLYRLAAAAGRDQDGFSQRSNQVDALEWWNFAEVRKATLGDAPVAPIVTQRMIALTSMPESCFLSQWRSGGCRLEAFNADQGLQDGLMFAEAFWSWSQWSAKWQEIQSGQCPGGSAVGCQTAALRSLKILFHGPKVYSQGQKEPSQAHPELRWPSWRSGLLQLRVIHQVSRLYDCLGESDLAIACADCGLELMERKLCGDCRWKLRFLCIRTRCAVSCFSDVTKEEHALQGIEDLWNRRIQGQPRIQLTTTCEGGPVEPVELDGTVSSPGMPWELLTLWANASSKQRRQGRLLRLLSQADEARLPSESVVLLIQLQMEDREDGELWTKTLQLLLKKISDHPSKAPFPRALCPALALLAQSLFNDLDGEGNRSWSLLKAAADLKQCCMVLSQPAQMIDIEVAPSLKSFLQVCAAALRGALFMGESAVARHCAQLLLRVEDVVRAASARPAKEEGTNLRERSPSRESGDIAFSRAQWKLCKQVVPCAFGVSLLFMTELRAMQRRLEKMDHWSALGRLGPGSTTSMLGVMAVEDICSGNWMAQLGSDMSLAWLQVDWKSSCLQISRTVDLDPARGAERLLSQRLPLRCQVLRGLQDELQQLHRSNSEKIKELWQRQDKKSEAVRLEFWRSRKGFDDQLGKLVEKIQKEVLGLGRFLLAPWPQSAAARQRVLDSLRSWLTNEAAEMAHGLRLNGQLDDPEQAEHVFLLALLLIEAENLEVAELLLVLGQLWDGSRSTLRRWAYSMRRHSADLRGSLKELNEALEVPLLLYVDGVMAQLPLEACPCLRQRNVVRGLAPSITLSSLASKPAAEATGFFVIDPAEDCAAMGDVKQLLTSWSSHGESWHGHTGKLPEPARVLEELCRKDVFVYLGHGERARQLLRHEKLQIAGEVAEENDSRRAAGLRSTLMLLGCSSVKIQGSMEGDIESFGLASSALLGGAPLVLGAQWDVLGGDLDKLASRLLQRWLKEGKTSCSRGGLLTALKDLRPKCLLPNLTGASLVCYGIPV